MKDGWKLLIVWTVVSKKYVQAHVNKVKEYRTRWKSQSSLYNGCVQEDTGSDDNEWAEMR